MDVRVPDIEVYYFSQKVTGDGPSRNERCLLPLFPERDIRKHSGDLPHSRRNYILEEKGIRQLTFTVQEVPLSVGEIVRFSRTVPYNIPLTKSPSRRTLARFFSFVSVLINSVTRKEENYTPLPIP